MITTRLAEVWRKASVFASKVGRKCGPFLRKFAEARGRLTLFFPAVGWMSGEG